MTGHRVVADAGPIIHLAALDALDLFSVFDGVAVPETVYEELAAGGVPDGVDDDPFSRIDVEYDPESRPKLDPGESAAIALCNERDSVLLTDDMEARESASSDGLEVHGSIGVVLLAYARDFVTADRAEELIRGLKQDTPLYLADPLVEHALRKIATADPEW